MSSRTSASAAGSSSGAGSESATRSVSGDAGRLRESSLDDGSSGGHGNQTLRHTASSLRPEGAGAWSRRSDSGEVLGLMEVDGTEPDYSKRSPRRDRRRTSLGTTRDVSRSSSSRGQNHAPVADVYSTNMPWIPAVIEFAKRWATFYCVKLFQNTPVLYSSKVDYVHMGISPRLEWLQIRNILLPIHNTIERHRKCPKGDFLPLFLHRIVGFMSLAFLEHRLDF